MLEAVIQTLQDDNAVLKEEVRTLRADNVAKDKRIGVLEEEVRTLRADNVAKDERIEVLEAGVILLEGQLAFRNLMCALTHVERKYQSLTYF